MDDTVRCLDVGLGDGRTRNNDALAQINVHVRPLCRLDAELFGFWLGDARCIVAARQHVVGQDRCQPLLVLGLEQVLHRAGRQLLEGIVGRRENRERSLALQRRDEIGGFDCRDERRQVLVSDGGIDDVALRERRCSGERKWCRKA